jgi:hypothetical protein
MVATTSAPGLRRGDFLRVRPANLQHHVGAERLIRRDKPRARRLIVGVGEPGLVARAMLDRDLCPKGDEFLDRFRAGCDARFPRIRFRPSGAMSGRSASRLPPRAAADLAPAGQP